MSLIPTISNPYFGAFVGGVVYGLAVCTAACIPYLAGYIAGVGANFKKGIKITMFFNGGRIVAYALIGLLVSLFSGLFRLALADTSIAPIQIYSSIAFGIVTIIIGVSILLKLRKPCECPANGKTAISKGKLGKFRFDFGAFTLGLSRGLILCPPLIALLVYSLPFSTPVDSVALAVLFGLGTALSPMLVLGGVTGWLLNKAPLLQRWLAIGGAGILIILGIFEFISAAIKLWG